jgi:hypothetical protein
VVRATDFFCFNCGKSLKPRPLATSFEALLMYYLGAVVLPPMGIIWGIKYLRQGNQTAKIHGAILIGITIIELIYVTIWTVNFMHTISSQINGQLNGQPNGLQGF